MKSWEEAKSDFIKNNHLIAVKKCCATCKHYYWIDYGNAACSNEELKCVDALGYEGLAHLEIEDFNVCDKWEDRNDRSNGF